jgi:hypothetical protein
MVCRKVNEGITEYLRARGLKNVTELTGTLNTAREMQDCAVSG